MKPNLILSVAALLGLAVSAPAQFQIEGLLGRHVRVSAQIGHGHDHGYEHCGYGRHNKPDKHRQHGYWRTVCEQVWVPGCYRTEYVPACYGWVYDGCGRRYWGIVAPACHRQVWVPGRYETRTRRIWVSC
jgi:hypothetical protein